MAVGEVVVSILGRVEEETVPGALASSRAVARVRHPKGSWHTQERRLRSRGLALANPRRRTRRKSSSGPVIAEGTRTRCSRGRRSGPWSPRFPFTTRTTELAHGVEHDPYQASSRIPLTRLVFVAHPPPPDMAPVGAPCLWARGDPGSTCHALTVGLPPGPALVARVPARATSIGILVRPTIGRPRDPPARSAPTMRSPRPHPWGSCIGRFVSCPSDEPDAHDARHSASGVVLVDQVLVSARNFPLLFIVIRLMSSADVGTFGLVYASFFLLALVRGLAGDPLVVRSSGLDEAARRARSSVTGGAVIVGFSIRRALVRGWLAYDATLARAIAALGVALVPLLLQDHLRLGLFAQGRPRSASANDAFVLVAQMAGPALLAVQGRIDVVSIILLWGPRPSPVS